ncbi:MAG: type II toxin-antitoxin system VapC family toxin [Thermocrispum sp.]
MILVDTSIWIDHLHRSEPMLEDLLYRSFVVQHPMVIGELALGTLRDRDTFLGYLGDLAGVPAATHVEVLAFVAVNRLHGRGLSLADAHLLASVRLATGVRLWTRDKRLDSAARELGVAFESATS